ncbi:MAG: hypothetical protein WCH98_06755 [Verrucomicrobiota bacterium]
MTAQPGHQFRPDSISLCDSREYSRLPSSKNLTDYYLLALAVGKGDAGHVRSPD